ncbi:MAG: YicC/YloC family endoribonuclease [Clostridia bacterium]|nr:YicC/YloC family endoribonuclease [Clostridia bacterium]
MIKSMTGYGRNEMILKGKKITCEIKSVNHRYSDYTIKVPRYYGFMEDRVRGFVSEYISRGKVDVYVAVESFDTADREIKLNSAMAQSYLNSLYELRDKFGLKDDISVMNVAKNSEIFKTEKIEEDEEELWNMVLEVLEPTVADFVAMREREGERIKADLCERVEYMKKLSSRIDEYSEKSVAEYKDRLYTKIKEILGDRTIDESRILTEVAIFADKVAVNEETVRLQSHYNEFYEIISRNEPAGRKLDFLIQEINREVNTTGSKACNIEIAKIVVELKGEIEKLREQIQNIE